jgi:hypothetical protein
VGYEWSAGTLQWLEDHGIEPHEVMQALYSTRRWPRPAFTAEGLQVLSLWGSTNNGRRLIVVLRATGAAFDWWIVNARDMTADEAAAFDKHWEGRS